LMVSALLLESNQRVPLVAFSYSWAPALHGFVVSREQANTGASMLEYPTDGSFL